MTTMRRGFAARAALVGTAALLVTAGAAMPATAAAPSPNAAEQSLPPGQRGRLLSEQPLTDAAALPSAAVNRAITYVSQGARGQQIVVSGTVSLPRTPTPPGGWPVLSWAHGTTGVADVCAPSLDTVNGPAHGYLSSVDPSLDAWVQHGYVVVQTDYEGLGTPGGHPYLNGQSAADTVTDIVRAARHVDPRIGKDFVVAGHSQGGHAALFAAATPDDRSDVRLLGVIAIAPGGYQVSQTAAYYQNIAALPPAAAPGLLAFLPTLLFGAQAADPAIQPYALVNIGARPLLDAGLTSCLDQARAVAATVPAADPFVPNADLTPLTDYLRQQEPERLTVKVPTLVAQGMLDTTVSKVSTDAMVSELCGRSHEITYDTYSGPDSTHRGTVGLSLVDAQAFADGLFHGRTPATTC